MKKCLISLLSIAAASLAGTVFAANDSLASKTYWISKSSDDHVLLKYDHKRHNMVITVDYYVDGKKGCGIEMENCGGRIAASRGDVVICIPKKDPNVLGVFLKSNCNVGEDEQLVATGSVEYIK